MEYRVIIEGYDGDDNTTIKISSEWKKSMKKAYAQASHMINKIIMYYRDEDIKEEKIK